MSLPSTPTLKVNEIFHSIQGESLLAGKPTTFVRTSTCNLRCTWCDTQHAYWRGGLFTVPEVMERVKSFHPKYVCVTGGEPLGQRATIPLLESLVAEGYTVSLETNGSFSVINVPKGVIKVIDIKCPDSGETEAMAWENLDILKPTDQLKFVVASRGDFIWAQRLCDDRKLHEQCPVLFSPVYGKVTSQQLAGWILDSDADVTMQVQMHKDLFGPETRGV